MEPLVAASRFETVRFATLHSDESLTSFAEAYSRVGPFPLTVTDLRSRQVFAGLADSGRLVCGFTLATEPPLRTLSLLPSDQLLPSKLSIPMNDVVDIAALWRSSSIAPIYVGSLYRVLAHQGEATGKGYVLLGTVDPRFNAKIRLAGDNTEIWSDVVPTRLGTVKRWIHAAPMAQFVAWAQLVADLVGRAGTRTRVPLNEEAR